MWRRGVRQILSLQATCLHAHGGVHRCPPSRVIAAHASTPAPALHQQPLQQVHRRSCASQPQQHQRKLVDASGGSFGQNALFAAAVVAAAAAGYTYVLRPAPAPKRPAPQPHDQGDAPASAVAEDPLVAAALQADGAVAAPLQARPLAAQQQQQQQEQEQRAAAPQAPAQARAPGQAPLPGPWVTEEVLAESLQRRATAENRLRGYLHVKQREVQTWLDQVQMMGRLSREEFEQQMHAVEDEVNLQTNIILYNIHDPHARRRYLERYGCTKWSEQALETIRAHSPLIELGAGLGHWQRELSQRGANVLAYDNMSSLPLPDVRIAKPEFVGAVSQGDEKQVAKHPGRTLLLVYPGPDDMAASALRLYKGRTLLYVGECRGGVNANDAFFDELAKNWECVATVPVEPFPEGYEKLWVLQRKARRGWW